jgi:polysaccharide chain length determinant protein (PEP-CTERM system associated)
MLGHRQMAFEEYVEIMRRRVWLLIIPPIALCAATYVVSLKLPNRYESKTLVVVDAQRVPDSIVKPVDTVDPGERLATMREQILSRTRLEPIVNQFGLFNDTALSPEDRVNELRKVIDVNPIQPMAETRTSGLPGFRIIVTLPNPRIAQQVCSEVTSMFIEEDLKSREQETEGMTDFLSKQVADAQQKMNEQDQKLADFKRQYIGELPDEEQSNLSFLTNINTQLDSVNQAIARDESNKAVYESLLNQRLADWKTSQQAQQTGVASPQALDAKLRQAEDDLAKLREKYTDDFPNVKAKREEVEDLRKQVATANAAAANAAPVKPTPAATAISAIEPPEIQQLRLELSTLDTDIQVKSKEQKKLQDEYASYQSRIQISPMVEQKYHELTRDSVTAQEDYNKLLHDQNNASMNADLERRQQGAQFRILDPASMPAAPTSPNRPLLAAGGFGGGLVLGLGIVLLLEMRDKSIRREADVDLFLKLPTLALVPSITPAGSGSRFIFSSSKDKGSSVARA